MPYQKKASQIKALILVVALELDRLEVMLISLQSKEREKAKVKKEPHIQLQLIKGGKDEVTEC